MINPAKLRVFYINFGHFIDHMLMLIFAKAAFNAGIYFGIGKDMAYAEMIPYGVPSLILFGACAPLAAFLADKWNRSGMLTVFFFGIGSAAILTGLAQSLLQVGIGLALIGVFASIYHPVGIAMLIERGGKVGWLLGMNGVWGNMGVAGAPLVTGFILAQYDWRMAFIIPGSVSIILGLSYIAYTRSDVVRTAFRPENNKDQVGFAPGWQRALFSLALVTAAGGFVFGGMTFLIPRLFDVRMQGISADIAVTGTLAAAIYVVAAFAQLVVGRQIDKQSIKPVLIFVACGQPVFLFLMAVYTDYSLFAVSLLAMGFVFGQIPITDAVLSQYVPDQWRTKVLSIKFLINLMIGAVALMTARYLLSSGSGFEPVMQALAISACIVVLAAFLLPKRV